MSPPRRLLARLREIMASGAAPLPEITKLVTSELGADACSIYVMRPGDILELMATQGLNPQAVGRTRLRVGEGIVGLAAATARVMNLADAPNHPAYVYRSETGEAPYASLLAVPVRRAGHTLGVIVVQKREPRAYTPEEVDVLETLAMVLAEQLAGGGASDGAEAGVGATLQRIFPGTILASGVVIGPVVVRSTRRTLGHLLAEDPKAELARLQQAVSRMQKELDQLIASSAHAGDETREVLEAYRLIAADPGWLRRAGEAIRSGLSAGAAVERVASEFSDRMRRVGDPYLRERLADVEDLAGRLLATLNGNAPRAVVPVGAILLARRLGPAELLDWRNRGIAGVVIEEGTPAGHAAIMARALGLPALGGARGALETAEPGDDAILDADKGELILRPDIELAQIYIAALEARTARQAGWAELRKRAARTADDVPFRLMLNIGLKLELDQLETTGADGIGLFRTEIAVLARGGEIDPAEQAALYSSVLDSAGDRPVLFRTLDLGADKQLPGAKLEEENPAMGWRSIRVGLDRPALLRRQLRALLLGAGGRALSVMFPMIATVAEFRAARTLLESEAKRVHPQPERLEAGAMLEIPSLLWQLPTLLRHADFISVGTNDLVQFLFAADRGTPGIADRYDLLSPPVFSAFEYLIEQADAAGVSVSVCGEAASRPLEALALAGLGVRTLSMSASAVLPVKAMLASLDLRAFRPVLATMRRKLADKPSLREPIATWAREHGLVI
ncbi:MAG: GAF domain-containing protein [Acetobacteraceae bacterium]|nr:GAF domain-containing protein [Acetobacteraceae bacterium]